MSGRDRKLAALRAMANQDASPRERDIAREKLRRYVSFTTTVLTHEQEAAAEAERQRQADEDVRADILRRWERGGFDGVTLRAGVVTNARHSR